jgi:hypothetical protein
MEESYNLVVHVAVIDIVLYEWKEPKLDYAVISTLI